MWRKTDCSPLRRVFRNQTGQWRVGWVLLLLVTAWVAGRFALYWGLTELLFSLCRLWGVNQNNLALAPAWMTFILNHASLLTGILVDGCTFTGFILPKRRVPRGIVPFFAALGLGFLLPLLFCGLFLMLDSLRLLEPAMRLTPDFPLLLASGAFASLARCAAIPGLAYRVLRERWSPLPSCVLSGALYFLAAGGYRNTAMGMLGYFLFGIALCVLTERRGAKAALGLETGYLWATNAVFAPAGGEAMGLFALYPVSEAFLTGGKGGLAASVPFIVLCAAFIARFILSNRKRGDG